MSFFLPMLWNMRYSLEKWQEEWNKLYCTMIWECIGPIIFTHESLEHVENEGPHDLFGEYLLQIAVQIPFFLNVCVDHGMRDFRSMNHCEATMV